MAFSWSCCSGEVAHALLLSLFYHVSDLDLLSWVNLTYEIDNPGVSYHNGKWAIFNEDGNAMPTNGSFDVLSA